MLVVAHLAAAVGLPVYARNPAGCGCHTSAECGASACGCRGGAPALCGPCGQPLGDCCCSTFTTKVKKGCCSTGRPRVQWVVAFAVKSCKSRGPLGLPAVEPAVPPASDPRHDPVPVAAFVVPVVPQFPVLVPDPPDPPPRGA